MSDKYAFINSEEGNYSVRKMCIWAKVSRSGYYEWRHRVPSRTAIWRAELAVIIEDVFADSDGTYGYRRMHAALARLGRYCDPQTVRSIMTERGLVACQPRPRGPITTIAADAGDTPDLLQRDFSATEPGRRHYVYCDVGRVGLFGYGAGLLLQKSGRLCHGRPYAH